MVVWNVCVKSIWTHSAPLTLHPFPTARQYILYTSQKLKNVRTKKKVLGATIMSSRSSCCTTAIIPSLSELVKCICLFFNFLSVWFHDRFWVLMYNCSTYLKSIHFKKTVARSSVHSKLWSFSIIHQLTLFWCQMMYYTVNECRDLQGKYISYL